MKKKYLASVFICTFLTITAFFSYDMYNFPSDYYNTTGENFRCVSAYPPAAASAKYDEDGVYKSQLKLFGILPIKTLNVTVLPKKYLIPSGQPFGIKLYTDGLLIIDMAQIVTQDGSSCNPAFDAGIRVKDILCKANDTIITSNEQFARLVEDSGGKKMKLSIKRGALNFEVTVTPVRSSVDGEYKIGLWVRDSTAGIGTITYYDPETSSFGGLGHGIYDVDTSELMTLRTSEPYFACINNVKKGRKGDPGALLGYFTGNAFGKIYSNTNSGVYGKYDGKAEGTLVEVAYKQDIKTGPVQILCTIDGSEPHLYAAEIIKLNMASEDGKNIMLKITDARLLELTGGIVQGMSGSPIIQNGKLIGAVTHVLLNDPTRGYGIFIENMMKASGQYQTAA